MPSTIGHHRRKSARLESVYALYGVIRWYILWTPLLRERKGIWQLYINCNALCTVGEVRCKPVECLVSHFKSWPWPNMHVIIGNSTSRIYRTIDVGAGSKGHDFMAAFLIIKETWPCVLSRSWISRDNNITIVFALSLIAALMRIFSGNALRQKFWVLAFWCAKFHKNIEVLWNFYIKAIIYAQTEYWTLCKQICNSLDVSGKFCPSLF